MSTSSRRKIFSIIQGLTHAPYNHSFIQTVRLLQRSALLKCADFERVASKPVARFTPPSTEVVRFQTNNSLSFPSTEIDSLSQVTNSMGIKQWKVGINFMGLTGNSGVLPYHYTETVLQRLKLKDESLKKFFDLFNHRTISLFYQASIKYNLAIDYEQNKTNANIGSDNHTQALLSLIGLGTKNLRNRHFTKDESLIYYSGLLTQQIKTSSGLKTILENHFKVPIKIKEFVGQWHELIDDVRSRLPSRAQSSGQNNRLGKSAMLGSKGWLAQGKFSIVIGPIKSAQLQDFSPGTKTLKSMDEMVRFYAGVESNFDFKIKVWKSDIPSRMVLNSKNPPSMGWNTWLTDKNKPSKSSDETIEISVSSRRLM